MRKINILVVDDDPDICDYMQLVLNRNGYHVETKTDQREALEELKSKEYHVAILDLMMPQINGM